jgi:hypothetical protein
MAYAGHGELSLDDWQLNWRRRRTATVKLQFSIRAYAIAVVYVAGLATLYKIVPWAIRTYHP